MSALTDPPIYATRAQAQAKAQARRPAPRGERRDPAPSRFSYRWHRIWLTPLYRRLLRLGIPAFLAALAFGIWFGEADRRERSFAWMAQMRDSIASRPEFRVSGLSVSGASPETAAAVAETLALTFPVSSLGLDLDALRVKLTGIDAVADAELRVNAEGALEVRVEERLPILVWRHGAGLDLLDETGHRVSRLPARGDRPDLPLIAGEGADKAVPEALTILAAAEPLRPRMRGLVRMGDRRWDIVLDRHQRIMLPAEGAAVALERIIALDQAEDLLDRDVIAVDFRNGHRPTLRLAPPAMATRLGLDPQARLASAKPPAPAAPVTSATAAAPAPVAAIVPVSVKATAPVTKSAPKAVAKSAPKPAAKATEKPAAKPSDPTADAVAAAVAAAMGTPAPPSKGRN